MKMGDLKIKSIEYRFEYKKKEYAVEYWTASSGEIKIAVKKDNDPIAIYNTPVFGDKFDAIALLEGTLRPKKQKF